MCAILFLVMAVQEAVIYRIIYMVLFLYFVITFKVKLLAKQKTCRCLNWQAGAHNLYRQLIVVLGL